MERPSHETIKKAIIKLIEKACSVITFSENEYVSLALGSHDFNFTKGYKDVELDAYVNQVMNLALKNRYLTGTSLNIKLNFKTKHNTLYTIISCQFAEFPACCGKILAYSIYFNQSRDTKGEGNLISIEESIEFLNTYFEFCRELLIFSPYTSLSIIISPENGFLVAVFPSLKRFRLINQFKNQRMPNKNLCQEFELNLDY